MKNSINILIVDNNHAKNSEKQQLIKEHSISNDVKVAMNAGHALLYLDHIHLNKKIYDLNLVIILNMDTPISNGYDFLSNYRHTSSLKKEKIHIIVVNENLCEEKKEKIKNFGVTDFIPDSFSPEMIQDIIDRRFNASARKKEKTSQDTLQTQAAA